MSFEIIDEIDTVVDEWEAIKQEFDLAPLIDYGRQVLAYEKWRKANA